MALLNKHNLGVARFASKEKGRYTLQVIQVTPKETFAANEISLVRVTRPDGPTAGSFPAKDGFKAEELTEPILLDADTALAAMKALPRKNTIPVLDFAAISGPDEQGDRKLAVTNIATWQEFRVPKSTGVFPRLNSVWKRASDAKFDISLDAVKLRDLLDAVVLFRSDKINRSTPKEVRLSFYDETKAVRLDAYNVDTEQQWTALLMPVHALDPAPEEPDFAPETPA